MKDPWSRLPIVNGEESAAYERLAYRYSHIGCPGAHMEDNCAHPSECALRGKCKDLWDGVDPD